MTATSPTAMLLRAMVLAATQGKRAVSAAVLGDLAGIPADEVPDLMEPLLAADVVNRSVLDGGIVAYYFSKGAAARATDAAVAALLAPAPLPTAARPMIAAPALPGALGPRENIAGLVETHIQAALAEADRLRRYAEGVRALADDLGVCTLNKREAFS